MSLDEQRRALAKRRGRTLTKRTILKSYITNDPAPLLPGVPDMRQADELPIFSVGGLGGCILWLSADYMLGLLYKFLVVKYMFPEFY